MNIMNNKNAELNEIKQILSGSFAEINRSVLDTVRELSAFIKMMDPFVDYFFSGGKGKNSFIGDIVAPSENDLTLALESAHTVGVSDAIVHSDVYDSLVKVMSLRTSVDTIVVLLDSIETYSINTIIMSAKAGTAGQALAAISGEMTRMSQLGSSLSASITDRMDSLINSVGQFSQMRLEIEDLHDSKLPIIGSLSRDLFDQLRKEFSRLSGEVLGQYGMLASVNASLNKVTEKFQYEDLVRQNIEKILFSLDEAQTSVKEPDSEVYRILADLKIDESCDFIKVFCNEMNHSLNDFSQVLDAFSGMLTLECPEISQPLRSDVLEELSQQFENLKMSFDHYILEILEKKKSMYSFLLGIEDSIHEFEAFFETIVAISKKFKTILLLTTIELSRQDDLKLLLEGALSDVARIPDRIGAVTSEGISQYDALISSFNSSLDLYHKKFDEQQRALNQCTTLTKKISLQIYESRKYHNDFTSETSLRINGMRDLMVSVHALISQFSDCGTTLAGYTVYEEHIDRDTLVCRYSSVLKALADKYGALKDKGDYRNMMLSSLISEFLNKTEPTAIVDFF